MRQAPSRRILIVDDEPDILEILDFYLAQSGFEVSCATSAQVALNLIDTSVLRGSPFDLVLTDQNMPGMSGLELVQAIESRFGAAAPKTLVITGAVGTCQTREFPASTVGVVTKPFSRHDVLQMIERAGL